MPTKVKNKHLFVNLLILLSVFILTGTTVHALNGDSLEGKWGLGALIHKNDGTWNSVTGTAVFKSDGTATEIKQFNEGGITGEITENFTYSTIKNPDGSITITEVFADRTEMYRAVFSDNGNMFILDGTSDITEQSMVVAVRMDESKTYSNADMSGDYYAMGYDYDSVGADWPGNYIAYSSVIDFDGVENYSFTSTWNADGTFSSGSDSDAYSVSSDGSLLFFNGQIGYITGDGKIGVASSPTSINSFENTFLMKKGDMDYSTAGPVGTFAMTGFGDYDGAEFIAMFGTMTCYGNGKCMYAFKNQSDGSVTFMSGNDSVTIAPDGSITSSNSAGAPSYAVAVGNNGNTIISNVSFSPDNPSYPNLRLIQIGVKCSDCSNLAGQMIPMFEFDIISCIDDVINLYLYDPSTGTMHTVKENCNEVESGGSLNSTRTMMVYAETVNEDTTYITIYDIAAKTNNQIRVSYGENFDFPVYFDDDDKLIFNDNGVLKRMDADGTNVSIIATPEPPYEFGIFWMSPDHEKIVAIESRLEGSDYYTGHFERLVLMNSDGTGRTVIKDEYLGEWNMLSWKPDSSGFLYYHHVFNIVGGVYQGKSPKYVLIDISDGTVTDLSDSDMGKEENICFPTKWGNLVSISYQELFNGKTGNLIMDVSQNVPLLTESLFGWDNNGEIYFADLDGSNFRRFVETSGYPFNSYDMDQDWVIGDFELLDAIDEWAENNLGDFELLDLIDYWAFGSYCWDALTDSYKVGVPDVSGACL